jgi:hypothetical protein
MEHKIILPFFTDAKFAGKPLTLIDCIAFLARRDGSHLLLISNFTELYLFKYSKDFVFEKEIPVTEVLNGFRQFNEAREYALSESASGQLIISGPANRCYIIDENGNIAPASYTTTVVNLNKDAHALFPQKQEAAAKNLYCNATLLPQSNKLIALVDSEMGFVLTEGKRRGDFIVISDAPFADARQRPRLKLLAALEKWPSASYTTDFPGIELKNGTTIHRDATFEDNLIAAIKSNNKLTFFNPWVGNMYPLTSSLFLVPVFDRYKRLSAGACFLLLNTDGTVVGQLQDIQPDKLKLKTLEEFHFAINETNQIIYFKGENTIYLFGFDGSCLDKIVLEGTTKPLAAFQLIGHTSNGNLLFFDRKNFHFLQLPQIKPLDSNNALIIENALTAYKKHKLAKPKAPAKKVKDDKHIDLHKVDHPEIITENFEWLSDKFNRSVEKSKHTFRFLFYIFRDAQELLQMSVLQKTELEAQQNWFRYGLNSISEFCRLVHFEGETKEVTIDESGAFEIVVEPSGEYVSVMTALCWATIARDTEKQKIIAGSPIKNWIYREEDWDKKTFVTCFLKLIKEYYLTENFNTTLYDEAQADLEKYKSFIGPDIKQKFGIYLMSRFLNAFKSLVENNEAEFHSNFALTLQAHKEVWSQKKALNRGGTPLCRENEGFLSWDCTTLAAMAFDKGWKLEVTSDYVPQSMVDGSINLK